MTKATISAKGQISIPKTIRERLVRHSSCARVQGEQVVMKRLVSAFPDWRSMRGMFRGVTNLQDDLAKERADELARDDARLISF